MKGILNYFEIKLTKSRHQKARLKIHDWWVACHLANRTSCKPAPEFAQVDNLVWSEVMTARDEMTKGRPCPKATSTKARIILRRAGFGKELDAGKR